MDMVDSADASAFPAPARALGISRLARSEQEFEQHVVLSEEKHAASRERDKDDNTGWKDDIGCKDDGGDGDGLDNDWVVLDEDSIPAAESLAFPWPSSTRLLLQRVQN